MVGTGDGAVFEGVLGIMKEKVKAIIYNPLFSGSAIMIIGSNATSFLNYLYHFVMGRLLGPSSYGELAAIFSLIGLLGMVPASLGLVIVKYVSAAKNEGEVRDLTCWLNHKVLIIGILILLAAIFGSSYFSSFVNIKDKNLIITTGIIFLFALPSTLNRSVLQGLLRFKQMVISVLLENSTKLLLGSLLVYFGLSVQGAVFGLIVAALIGWILTRAYMNDCYRKISTDAPNIKPLLLYSVPVMIQSVAITSLYSTDLVLVKHFFSSYEAGLYAAVTKLGQIVFFATGPIVGVMFPLISQRQSQGKNYLKVFLVSLVTTIVLSGFILVLYYLGPKFAINMLFGSLYIQAEQLLVLMGVFAALFSVSSLFVSFNLSLGRAKVVIFPLLASIGQVIGIYLMHQSLATVIIVSITVTLLLLIGLIIFTAKPYFDD